MLWLKTKNANDKIGVQGKQDLTWHRGDADEIACMHKSYAIMNVSWCNLTICAHDPTKNRDENTALSIGGT